MPKEDCWPSSGGRIQVYAHKGKESTLQKDQDSEEMQEHPECDWGWSRGEWVPVVKDKGLYVWKCSLIGAEYLWAQGIWILLCGKPVKVLNWKWSIKVAEARQTTQEAHFNGPGVSLVGVWAKVLNGREKHCRGRKDKFIFILNCLYLFSL